MMAFVFVANSADLQEAATLPVMIGREEVLLCRYNGTVFGVHNYCSHMVHNLTGGRIRRGQIVCPVHGARFDLATGAVCGKPAILPIRTYKVRELDGKIEVWAENDTASV